MILKHRIEYVDGDIDTDTQKLSCGGNRKYGTVALCFDCGMSVSFADIKLHSSDKARDAKAVWDDAHLLGAEIARRWNEYNTVEKQKKEQIDYAVTLQDTIDAMDERIRELEEKLYGRGVIEFKRELEKERTV